MPIELEEKLQEVNIGQTIIDLNEMLDYFCTQNKCNNCKLNTKKGNCFKNKAQENMEKIVNKFEEEV